MSAADNMVSFIRGFGERRKAAKVGSALRNYLSDPAGTVAAVNQIDAPTAITLNRQRLADETAQTTAADAASAAKMKTFSTAMRYVRAARDQGTDPTTALTKLSPFLKANLNIGDADLQTWGQTLTDDPSLVDASDEDFMKAKDKLANDVRVVAPGAGLAVGGKIRETQPFAPKVVTVRGGDGSSNVDVVDPNGPAPVNPYDTVVGYGQYGTPPAALSSMRMGDVYNFGRSVLIPGTRAAGVGKDSRGVIGSSASGAYQITGENMRRLAPKVIGPDWQTQPFSAENQDKMGQALYDDAQARGTPLNQVWRGLSAQQAAALKGVPWDQAKATIVSAEGTNKNPRGGPSSVTVDRTVPAPSKAVIAATPQELKDAGYPDGTAAQKDANGKFINLKLPPKVGGKYLSLGSGGSKTIDLAKGSAEGFDRLAAETTAMINDPALDGAVGNIYGRLPQFTLGQRGTTAQNKLIAIKSNVGLNALQAFKAMSATGASGFGALSDKEGERLERWLGTLDLTNDPKTIRETLGQIRQFAIQHSKDLKAGLTAATTPAPSASAAPRYAYKRDAQGNVIARVQYDEATGKWKPVRFK